MAQRSESRAVAKVRRTEKDVPPKKAAASAVPKGAPKAAAKAKSTSPEVKNAPKSKTTLRAGEKAKHAQKGPVVAGASLAGKSRAGKAKQAVPTAKSRTAVPKVQPEQKNKPQAGAVAVRASRPVDKAKLAPSAVKSPKGRIAGKAKAARKGKSKAGATASSPAKRPAKAQQAPSYLAAELGQPVDHRGEPIGAGSSRAKSDTALQDYTLQLWRQMQSGRVVNRYTRAIERAGLTTDEVWTAGITEVRPTSSTSEEMRRYRQKLLFRANLLEAILSETVADLHRLDGIEPASAETARESG